MWQPVSLQKWPFSAVFWCLNKKKYITQHLYTHTLFFIRVGLYLITQKEQKCMMKQLCKNSDSIKLVPKRRFLVRKRRFLSPQKEFLVRKRKFPVPDISPEPTARAVL